jgi:hypothetical protein
MRSIGGGVGLLQTIPAGSVADFAGVGVGAGVGLATTTGVRTGVGVEGWLPHATSANPAAAESIAHASARPVLRLARSVN